MNLENTNNRITAERLYLNREKGGLSVGYTALESWGLRGWLARRLMELQRQMDRTQGSLEEGKEGFLHWKHQRVGYEIEQLKRMFRTHGHEMTSFAELQEFKYGFRVRLVEGHRVIRYRHGLKRTKCTFAVRGRECGELILNWRSSPGNVSVVLEYTDKILGEALGKRTGELPGRITA